MLNAVLCLPCPPCLPCPVRLSACLPAEGQTEGETFSLLNDRTLGGLVAAMGAHLDATLK